MKKWIILAVLLCAPFFLTIGALPANAQFTLVSGTVTDPNGLPWACGTISATLINNNGVSATLNGAIIQGSTAPVKLGCPTDPTTSRTPGAFQMQLADNTVIKCGIATCGTQTTWSFTANTTGIAPPQGTGPQSFTNAFTISGSSQTLSFSNVPVLSNAGGGASAPGVFTNTQQNDPFTFVLNGCSPGNVFSNVIAPNGNFGTDALAGCITVPSSGVTNGFSSAVAGYAINLNGTSACAVGTNCSAVGVSGIGWSQQTNALVWGGNFVSQSTAGKPTNQFGVEINTIMNNTGDTGAGLLVSPFGSSTPTANFFPAIEITPGSSNKYKQGIDCEVAATAFSICLQARPGAAGNSQASQTIELDATNGSGATVAAAFQEQPAGTTKLIGAGGFLQHTPVAFSAVPACSGTTEGSLAAITDSTVATWGTAIAGGGANHVLGYCDGTSWKVAAP